MGFAQSHFPHEILKMPRAMLVVVFLCEIFLKENYYEQIRSITLTKRPKQPV